MKRNFYYLVIITTLLLGFQLSAAAAQRANCTIKGSVYWYYNSFVGYRADTGAKVIAYRRLNTRSLLDPNPKETDVSKGLYFTTAGLDGKFELKNLPPGTYDIVFVSKAVIRDVTSPKIEPTGNYSGYTDGIGKQYNDFQKYILEKHYSKDQWEGTQHLLGVRGFQVRTVTLTPGQEENFNVDFGRTEF